MIRLESIFIEKSLDDCIKENAERKFRISQIERILCEHHPFGSASVIVTSHIHINYVLFTVLCQSTSKYFEIIVDHAALNSVIYSQMEQQISDRVATCLSEKHKVV